MEMLFLDRALDKRVHQNRLLKIAREGAPMTAADLAKFEPQRRYATLEAWAIEGRATVIDEIIDLHDRVVGKMFQMAKHRHGQQFQESGKAISDRPWSKPRKPVAIRSPRSNRSCPGTPSKPA